MPKPKDAKQQACAPSSLILACYFAPVKRGVMCTSGNVEERKIAPIIIFVSSFAVAIFNCWLIYLLIHYWFHIGKASNEALIVASYFMFPACIFIFINSSILWFRHKLLNHLLKRICAVNLLISYSCVLYIIVEAPL